MKIISNLLINIVFYLSSALFCTDCLKGICSYCKVYGDEKHPDLQLLSDIFKNCKSREKEKGNFDSIIRKLNIKTKQTII